MFDVLIQPHTIEDTYVTSYYQVSLYVHKIRLSPKQMASSKGDTQTGHRCDEKTLESKILTRMANHHQDGRSRGKETHRAFRWLPIDNTNAQTRQPRRSCDRRGLRPWPSVVRTTCG